MPEATTVLRTLENGLTVVVHPRPGTPVAGLFVFYRVGSRHEGPGQTGISHFLEHMCFKDNEQFPWRRYEVGLYRRGTTLNAFTSWDTTCYWEVLPKEYLETAVAIEARRMGQLRFDPEVAVRERSIIVAEREGGENRPGYLLQEEMLRTAYPTHTYGHMTIGSKEDIRAVTAESLTRHYQTYYRPDNAVVVVVGDVAPDQAVEMVSRHMGHWPAGGPTPQEAPREAPQTEQRRVLQRRPAPVPEGGLIFKVPGAAHPDTVALDVLATLLGGAQGHGPEGAGMGRSSRFYRSLVQAGLAAGVGVGVYGFRDPQPFWIDVTGRPDSDVERIEAVIWEELARVAREAPPAQELERARQQLRAQWLYAQETAMGLGLALGRSVISHPSPEEGVEAVHRFLADLDAVTAADLQRVAAAYLQPHQATVGWLLPAEGEPEAAAPKPAPAGGAAAAAADPDDPAPVAPGGPANPEPQPVTGPPSSQVEREWGESLGLPVAVVTANRQPAAIRAERVIRRELPGGTLLVYPMAGVATVVARAYLAGVGTMADPDGAEGRARLTANLLTRGFAGREPRLLDDYLDSTGMSLRAQAGVEGVGLSLRCLADHREEGLRLLAQAMTAPDFPEPELERARQQLLTAIRQHQNSTSAMAGERLYELAFPAGHPYSRPSLGEAGAIRAIQREELAQFHREQYGRSPLIVAVAGAVDPDRTAAVLAEALQGRGGDAMPPAMPPAGPPAGARAEVGIPGKSQSDLAMGFLTVPRSHPDWMGLRLLAAVLGNPGLMSRLFKGVRELLGLSYSQYASLGASNLAPAVWSVRIGCATHHVPVALAAIEQELDRLRSEPVPAEELDAVRDRLVNSQTVGLESPDAVAGQLLEQERLGLGMDYLERFPDLLARWDGASLAETAGRHLDPGRLLTVVAGPPSRR